MNPSILQINKKPEIEGEVGLPKNSIEKAEITKYGIKGDFNRFRKNKKNNDPDMALLLLSSDIIDQLNTEGWPVKPGDLGENLTLINIKYDDLSPGKKYLIGSTEIEITFICDPCSNLKALPYVGNSRITEFINTLMKRRGWYAKVLKKGEIVKGDQVIKG